MNNQETEHTNNIKLTQHKEALLTAQNIHQKKPKLRDRTDRTWFSRLVRHPAKKQSGSFVTTPERARLHGASTAEVDPEQLTDRTH